MRKDYPYLQDRYYAGNETLSSRMAYLKQLDDYVNQKQYIRVILLNWEEEPLKEIQGELESGSLNKDGMSAVRRTCSFTCTVDNDSYDIDSLTADYSLNKKVFVEIGVQNDTNEYIEHKILWFPQGVFLINSFSASSAVGQNLSLSFSLKDKMALLDGTVGGDFPALTRLDEQEVKKNDGTYITEKVKIYNLIQEIVHHIGGEDLVNIVIEDVPNRIKRILKWGGENPLYQISLYNEEDIEGEIIYLTDIEDEYIEDELKRIYGPEIKFSIKRFVNGNDIGYCYNDFYYDTELTANMGETVVSILDKIKEYLGNFEYFYDEFGVFHFREIKDYLNTTQVNSLLSNENNYDYNSGDFLIETTIPKSVYSFNQNSNIISIDINPDYSNIKNDYIVQGETTDVNGYKSAIRYHLAIDEIPSCEYHNNLLFYEDSDGIIKAAIPQTPIAFGKIHKYDSNGKDTNEYQTNSNGEEISTSYYCTAEDILNNWNDIYLDYTFYMKPTYNDENKRFIQFTDNKRWIEVNPKEYYCDGKKYIYDDVSPYDIAPIEDTDIKFRYGYLPTDYRVELYLRGLENLINGIDRGYYFEELSANLPLIYDFIEGRFVLDENLHVPIGNYWLDIISPQEQSIGDFCVGNIGRRQYYTVNNNINCLFVPDIDEIILINNSKSQKEVNNEIAEAHENGMIYSLIDGDIYENIWTGGSLNPAFDQIRYDLTSHTVFQKTINIQSIPIFYLEPNERINVYDEITGTKGDFNIKTISFQFGPQNTMTTTANEVVDKI